MWTKPADEAELRELERRMRVRWSTCLRYHLAGVTEPCPAHQGGA